MVFLEALPRQSLDGGLRITEQVEVIGQKYNTPTTPSANLEWLLTGSFGGRLLSSKAEEDGKVGELREQLATVSRRAYRALLLVINAIASGL